MITPKRLSSLVAITALTSGIGLAGAVTPAHAWDPSVWDRVAACESSGNWSINTGNSFYGGLQFTRSTWLAFGGGTYASYAHQASKTEQIAIARRTLSGQGPGAWPVCSLRAGLTRSNGGAHRQALPAGSSAVGGTSTAVQAAPTSQPSTSSATRSYTVARGDTLSVIASRHNVSGGWRGLWNLNKSTAGNPNMLRVGQKLVISDNSSGSTSAAATALTSSTTSASTPTYTVRSGDTLSAIASRHNVSGGWRGLWNLNKSTVGNPNMLRVGQQLTIS